jgi:uncharacterized RDD family membrane protein YckC
VVQPVEQTQGLRAGFVSRVAADMVDGAVVLLVGAVAALVVAMVRSLVGVGAFHLPRLRALGTLGGASAVFFLYLAFFWGTTGRTLGKQLVGLRVVTAAGGSLRAGRAALRAALCVVFPVGLLWVLVSRRNAAVHDLLLRTAVVYDWHARRPASSVPAAG